MQIENGYVVLEDGTRLKAISGGGSMMGGGGGGGGDMAGAAGMGSSMDWTFGQGKVWDEKTKRQMQLLHDLIGASGGAGAHSTASAQSVPPAQVHPMVPFILSHLLGFGGR